MCFFKKVILAAAVWLVFPSFSKGLLSLPFLYPVKNAEQFNETSRYVSGFRYSWAVSAYLPEHVQQALGSWQIQWGGGWLHTIPRKRSSASSQNTKKKKARS